MQPNYFELAKSLMVEQGQQMLDRLKQAEATAEATAESTLIQCANCKDHLPADGILEFDGLSFCSEDCAIEHEASDVEFDNTCHVCQGTGEGQNDYCSCYACRGTGVSK